MLLKHLAQTERDIAEGKKLIENQERIIAKLRGGRDTWKAKTFLGLLLESQTLHQQDRDRLRTELAELKN